MARPRGWVGRLEGAMRPAVAAQPEVTGKQAGTPGPEAAAGIAQEGKPPADTPVSPDPAKVGPQDAAVIGSTGERETAAGLPEADARDYGKKAPPVAGADTGVSVGVDPTIAAATEAVAPSRVAVPDHPQLRNAREIGVNAAGERVFENDRGLRRTLRADGIVAIEAPEMFQGLRPYERPDIFETTGRAAPQETIGDLLRQRNALTEASSPEQIRDLANRFRGAGAEAPARQLELVADTIERMRPPAEAQPVMQQAQQIQPPAEAPPPSAPPPVVPPAGPPAGAPPPAAPPPTAAQRVGRVFKTIADSIKAKLAPQTLGDQARAFSYGVNEAGGLANQAHQRAMNEVTPHLEQFRNMSEAEGDAFMKRYQTGQAQPTPELQAADAAVRRGFKIWADHLGTLDRAQEMDWLENYLPGMYKNRQQAEQLVKDYARGGMGGAGSLEKKTYQSYAEAAEKAGLEPLTRNPAEMLELYGTSMRNFATKQAAIEHGLQTGTIIKAQPPERVGAAGAKEPLIKTDLPVGFVQSKAMPGHYMPWEVAQVFDNAFSTHGYKNITDALKSMNSMWTNLELGLNGYHAFTMANEGLINQTGIAFEKLMSGNIPGAARELAKVPLAPVAYAKRGTEVQRAFLEGQNSQSPVAKITQQLVEAGFNPIGRQHAQDVAMGQKAFLTSLSDMPKQIRQALKEAGAGLKEPLSKGDMLQLGANVLKGVQRVIATSSHSLFDVYIPKLKAGAAYEQMRHWHEMNPGASPEQITKAANTIVSSIDNRFGEMHTNRLFMDGLVKDAAMSSLRATSWLIGSLKEIGGGAYTIGRGATRAAIERDPGRLGVFNPSSPHYDPRATYVVAMFANLAMMSTAYQYLFGAGELPKDWRDIYAPRTGGTAKGAPEHMLMPGYHKDIYGWLAHPGTEVYNKLSGAWQTAIEEARGRETPALGSLPFVDPRGTFLQNVGERLKYLGSKLGPISLKNVIYGQEKSSAIPLPMAAIGFRATCKAISAPEQMERAEQRRNLQEYKQRQKRIQREYSSRNYAQGGVVEQPRTVKGPRTFVNPKYARGGSVVSTPSYKPQWRMAPYPAYGRMSRPFKPDKPVDLPAAPKRPKQPKAAPLNWTMPSLQQGGPVRKPDLPWLMEPADPAFAPLNQKVEAMANRYEPSVNVEDRRNDPPYAGGYSLRDRLNDLAYYGPIDLRARLGWK